MRASHQRELIEAQFQRVRADTTGRWKHPRLDGTDLYVTLVDPWTHREFLAHLDLRDYDLEAPKFLIVDKRTRKILPKNKWPPNVHIQGPTPGFRKFVHETLHPETGEAWCCVEGTWQFHAHYHHKHVPWDMVRNKYDLYRILDYIMAAMYAPMPAPVRSMRA